MDYQFSAKRMRELRERQGLSQIQMGRLVGVPFQRIQDHEAGRSIPKADRLAKIASVLGTNIEYLTGVWDYDGPLTSTQLQGIVAVNDAEQGDFFHLIILARKYLTKKGLAKATGPESRTAL